MSVASTFRNIVAFFVAALFCSTSGFASEKAKAIANFGANKSKLYFTREGEAVKLASYKISAVFYSAQPPSSIEEILLGKGPIKSSFEVVMTAKASGNRKASKGYAICDWNERRTVAKCGIESDGGNYIVKAIRKGADLRSSKFSIFVIKSKQFNGFYLTQDENEPDSSILVSVKRGSSVEVPVSFQ